MKQQIRPTLRPVVAADKAFLFRLFVDVRAELFAVAGLSQQQMNQLMELQFQAQQREYATHFPNASMQLILLAEIPIGYHYVARQLCLIDIALLSSHRNCGIGGELVSQLIQESVASGKPILAHVAKDNPKAWALWQRLGFSIVAEQGLFYRIEFQPANR